MRSGPICVTRSFPARSAQHHALCRRVRRVAHSSEEPVGGAFAREALYLYELGLAPIPCGGSDGKKPLIKAWQRNRLSGARIKRLAAQHPTANVGVVCGLSKVVIVDIDDPKLLEAMLLRFGESPLVTRTPSGGFHLWYRQVEPMTKTDLKSEGFNVDILASNPFVVVPPSRNFKTGNCYCFDRLDWDCLAHLPEFRSDALRTKPRRDAKSRGAGIGGNGRPSNDEVSEGRRNTTLFLACLRAAHRSTSVEEVIDFARRFNRERNVPPLSDREVVDTAASAWRYQREGTNWIGTSGVVPVSKELAMKMAGEPGGGEALILHVCLQCDHAARNEPFAVSPRGMAAAGYLPRWTEYRYRKGLEPLVKQGLLERIKKGGRGPGDASLYQIRNSGDDARFFGSIFAASL